MIRTAISPRLATRIFSNMWFQELIIELLMAGSGAQLSLNYQPVNHQLRFSNWPHLEHGLSKLHRFGIFHENLRDHSFDLRLDLVHDLHRLDDANDCVWIDLRSDFDVAGRLWR